MISFTGQGSSRRGARLSEREPELAREAPAKRRDVAQRAREELERLALAQPPAASRARALMPAPPGARRGPAPLALDELAIGAARARHQLGGRAGLDDAPAGEAHDPIRVAQRREAMRHEQDRAVAPPGGQVLEQLALGRGVERGGRLVEHEDRRVLEHGARDRDALALPGRELRAALAEQRVVALRQRGDEGVGAGDAGGGAHLGVARVRPRMPDVLAHRGAEEQVLLQGERDARAQARELQAAQIDAVDLDATRVGIEQAQQQRQQRALAGPGRAEQRRHGSARRLERDVRRARAARAGRRSRRRGTRSRVAAARAAWRRARRAPRARRRAARRRDRARRRCPAPAPTARAGARSPACSSRRRPSRS